MAMKSQEETICDIVQEVNQQQALHSLSKEKSTRKIINGGGKDKLREVLKPSRINRIQRVEKNSHQIKLNVSSEGRKAQ